MIEAKKLKLGLFIIISFSLLFFGLLALGLMDSFKEKYEFFTVFDESVQGLEKGAPIKYKGVNIGKVTKVSVWKDRYVRVDMEADPDSINSRNSSKNKSRVQNIQGYKDYLQREVIKGLRCRLEIASLATGLKFIELSHMDSRKREVLLKEEIEGKDNFIPAMKSLLSGAITNFDKTLTNIAKIDYEGIGIEAKTTLLHLNKILSNPKIASILTKGDRAFDDFSTVTKSLNKKIELIKVTELQETLINFIKSTNERLEKLQKTSVAFIDNTDQKLEKLLSNADSHLSKTIPELTKHLNSSLDKFDKTILDIQTQIAKAQISTTAEVARDVFKKVSKSFDGIRQDTSLTLKQARDFIISLNSLKTDVSKALHSIEGAGTSVSSLRKDFTSSLKRLKGTLDSISSFVDYLEKDPSSLLRGKATD